MGPYSILFSSRYCMAILLPFGRRDHCDLVIPEQITINNSEVARLRVMVTGMLALLRRDGGH